MVFFGFSKRSESIEFASNMDNDACYNATADTTPSSSLSITAAADEERSESEASSDVQINDNTEDNLTMLQAAALLTADCMGTGLLALPQDIQVLGWAVGLGFLILNLPINWYAGCMLSDAALEVERRQHMTIAEDDPEGPQADGLMKIPQNQGRVVESDHVAASNNSIDQYKEEGTHQVPDIVVEDEKSLSAARDYVCMAQAIFHHPAATSFQPRAVHLVAAVFYVNIFLVLGDYILVQSHAVVALMGEGALCLPTAGIIASTLMFGLSQLRTMAKLGHSVTAISLICLVVVVFQCLLATTRGEEGQHALEDTVDLQEASMEASLLRKLSAFASIGFAVGSNKLVLNIRHEMKDKRDTPRTVGVALAIYGGVYVAICICAGTNPPSFLFDAIPQGLSRKIAGLLLWIHVAVSYAINSQAICSSVDESFFCHIQAFNLHHYPERRWFILTAMLTVSSYLVANMVPFFKDLVSLIGALTAVPLTLLLPVIFFRRLWDIPLCYPTRDSMGSYALLIFSLVFLGVGLIGAFGSIEMDWKNQGRPFSCTV